MLIITSFTLYSLSTYETCWFRLALMWNTGCLQNPVQGECSITWFICIYKIFLLIPPVRIKSINILSTLYSVIRYTVACVWWKIQVIFRLIHISLILTNMFYFGIKSTKNALAAADAAASCSQAGRKMFIDKNSHPGDSQICPTQVSNNPHLHSPSFQPFSCL